MMRLMTQSTDGFSLLELMVASALLCIAGLAAIQFLGCCALLVEKARQDWVSAFEMWNESRKVRIEADSGSSPAGETFPGIEGLYFVKVEQTETDLNWEILLNEKKK